ncbi:uncharacterized protein LOC121855080 [Homarus americanus]|uniref:uncharacterized protein LOC121855080 n=1 Tax=Homarus americanus TaxID=6706 RepID=UPI001C43CD4D|nr:uncharacterized protein LOC121855080 [Homarus americanus]
MYHFFMHTDVHLLPGVDPNDLECLPSQPISSGIKLFLYNVDDTKVEWANRVVRALYPVQGKYTGLVFKRNQLSPKGCKDLVDALANNDTLKGKIEVEHLDISSQSITSTDNTELPSYTKRKLPKCNFN